MPPWVFVMILLAVLLLPLSASTHALLISAEPAVGSTLDYAPVELRLTFDQPIALQSSVRLLTTDFRMIETERQYLSDQPHVLVVQVPTLDSGLYTVEYNALSADGDVVLGSYQFAIELPPPPMLTLPWLPALYFLVFLLVAVGWRTLRVWQLTGVNALFRYRTDGVHGLASSIFRLVFVGIAGVLLAHALFEPARTYLVPIDWLAHDATRLIGWSLLTIALVIVVIAQVQMGAAWRIGIDEEQTSELVTHGIFRYSRNPIFLAIRVCFLGLFLVLPTAATLVLWILGDVMMQIQVRLEESYLSETFGNKYMAYAQATRRWI